MRFHGALLLAGFVCLAVSPAFAASDPLSTAETRPLGAPAVEPEPVLVEEGHTYSLSYAAYLRLKYPMVGVILDIGKKLAIISLFFLPFQLLFPLVKRKGRVFTKEFWIDVLYWYQGLFWPLFAFYGLSTWASQRVWGSEVWFPNLHDSLPLQLQLVLAIWAFDFVVYWRHRMEHTLAPLWWFHATHHTATSVDPLTTGRLHVFELMLGSFLNAIVTHIGFHPLVMAVAFPIYLHWNYFIHANLNIRFPGFLKYVLVSPFMHQWHHAADVEARGKNVGVVFAWNDWIFGTAYHPSHAPTEFGIGEQAEGEEIGRTPIGHFLYPFKMAFVTTWRFARPRPAPAP